MNPFVYAGMKVLMTEAGVSRWVLDKPYLIQVDMTRYPVNVVMGVTGKVQGLVVYGMDLAVAKHIIKTMTGQALPVHDVLAESVLGELGNLITGQASMILEEIGYPCRISPPAIVRGTAVRLTAASIPMVGVPISTGVGSIMIQLALGEGPGEAEPTRLGRSGYTDDQGSQCFPERDEL